MSENHQRLRRSFETLRVQLERARLGEEFDVQISLEELDRLERITTLLSEVAVEAEEESERRLDQLSLLKTTGDLLSSVFDLDQLSDGLLQVVADTLVCEVVALYLTDSAGALRLQSTRGNGFDRESEEVSRKAAEHCFERNDFTAVENSLDDPRLASLAGAQRLRSLSSVPLTAFGEPIGVLQLSDSDASAFDGHDHRMLTQLAGFAAVAVHHARLCSVLIERGHDLDQLVRARTRELEGARDALARSERLAALATLAGNLAHEVTNPASYVLSDLRRAGETLRELEEMVPRLLSAAEAASEIPVDDEELAQARRLARDALASRSGPPLPAQLREFGEIMRDIQEGLERISGVALDLGDFARSGPEGMRAADLNEVVESAVRIVRRLAKPNVEFEEHLDRIPKILCHRLQVMQALVHLLENAVEATEDGGVVRVQTAHSSNYVHIEICDNGPGVPSELRGRIFDPFFTTKEPGRSGLGLSIAKDIAATHGGSIGCEVEEGGALFRLSLPMASSDDQSSGTGGS